jgi:hypothetical protein
MSGATGGLSPCHHRHRGAPADRLTHVSSGLDLAPESPSTRRRVSDQRCCLILGVLYYCTLSGDDCLGAVSASYLSLSTYVPSRNASRLGALKRRLRAGGGGTAYPATPGVTGGQVGTWDKGQVGQLMSPLVSMHSARIERTELHWFSSNAVTGALEASSISPLLAIRHPGPIDQ